MNWEHLPEWWREQSKEQWERYGLFSLKGYAQLLGGAKPDLAMLFTYVCADRYLKGGGRLGFLITQTVFKTKGAEAGFRRFQLGPKGDFLGMHRVDGFSNLQPFGGAVTRTALFTLVKGERTFYPVPYTLWERQKGQRITGNSTLEEARSRTRRHQCCAEPIDSTDPTSPWITASRPALAALRKVVKPSAYRAYAGTCTWLNGAFWVRILEKRRDGLVLIENLGGVGRKKVPTVRATVELELLYPLLRGRDVQSWQAACPEVVLLLPQDCQLGIGGLPRKRAENSFPRSLRLLSAL